MHFEIIGFSGERKKLFALSLVTSEEESICDRRRKLSIVLSLLRVKKAITVLKRYNRLSISIEESEPVLYQYIETR